MPPLNIDEDFATAMSSLGAKRPVEINPDCEEYLNADLVLEQDNVIIEVKTSWKTLGTSKSSTKNSGKCTKNGYDKRRFRHSPEP